MWSEFYCKPFVFAVSIDDDMIKCATRKWFVETGQSWWVISQVDKGHTNLFVVCILGCGRSPLINNCVQSKIPLKIAHHALLTTNPSKRVHYQKLSTIRRRRPMCLHLLGILSELAPTIERQNLRTIKSIHGTMRMAMLLGGVTRRKRHTIGVTTQNPKSRL